MSDVTRQQESRSRLRRWPRSEDVVAGVEDDEPPSPELAKLKPVPGRILLVRSADARQLLIPAVLFAVRLFGLVAAGDGFELERGGFHELRRPDEFIARLMDAAALEETPEWLRPRPRGEAAD